MKKLNNYKFWMSLFAAVIVLINALGSTFGFAVNEIAITSIFTAVLGVFVTLGLIKKETKENEKSTQNMTDDKTNGENENLPETEKQGTDLDDNGENDAEKQGEISTGKVDENSADIKADDTKSTKSNKDQ